MNLIEDHTQWPIVKEVILKLKAEGFKAYLVGGSVRDQLMGRPVGDLDIVTDATPDQVENVFDDTLKIGKSFGITMIPNKEQNIEIATLRKESNYKDGRHPEIVEYVNSPEEDSKRRDFTINSLFLDIESGEIFDYQNGKLDITKKIIKTVGLPLDRFSEDYLRLYRAIRFSAQLGFEIEKNTYRAVVECSKHNFKISKERIIDEVIKILKSKNNFEGIQQLNNIGLLSTSLDCTKYTYNQLLSVKKSLHTLRNSNLETGYLLSLLLLPKYIDKETVSTNELKLSKKQNNQIKDVFSAYDILTGSGDLKKSLVFLSTKDWLSLVTIMKTFDVNLEHLDVYLKKYEKGWPQPFLTGKDLIELKLEKKSEFKNILNKIYGAQLVEELNSKEEAIKYVKANFK